ncbi:ABC transporter, ATP-binding protein [Clostridiales bacterium oral taxon 876 str. F0540]|nr:ABC transporter, ATP-binding protein [Clostridiales bacterium oral taxon 876 str. F0540]
MLKVNNLCFSYNPSSPFILDNINLHIEDGSYVSILGENGSAKSTFVKLILGFLKPNSGSIAIDTNKIGYVPQRMESYNSQFPITVYEMLSCHMKAIKLKDKSLITDSLKKVGMLEYKNSLIGKLSGGQQQKIFIARSIMSVPKLLVLDEPSTGIDIMSQKEIYQILKELNIKHKVTVISIEHNLTAALENSTHIFKLEKGSGTLYTAEEYKNLRI